MHLIDEHIQTLSSQKIDGHAISIYLPTGQSISPEEIQQAKTRFKNAVQEISTHKHAERLKSVIHQLETLLEDEQFWHNQDKSLAIFATNDFMRHIPLAIEIDAMTFIDDAFFITPLMIAQNAELETYILDINLTRPRLIHAMGTHAEEVTDIKLPASLEKEANRDEFRDQIQHQSVPRGSQGNAGMHGHNGADSHQADIDKYLGDIAEAIDLYLQNSESHLILAGTESRVGNLRAKLKHVKACEEWLQGNYENSSAQDIVHAAEEIRSNILSSEMQYESEIIDETPPEKHLIHEAEITEAAHIGRIDRLYIPSIRAGTVIDLTKSQIKKLEKIARSVLSQGGRIIAADTGMGHRLHAVCRY